MASRQDLEDIANKLRIHSVNQTTASNSGLVETQTLFAVFIHFPPFSSHSHPTSCASAAELMSCVFFNEMRFDR